MGCLTRNYKDNYVPHSTVTPTALCFILKSTIKLQLLNGDYIAALVFTYLSRQLAKCDQDLTIGYIYTGYTNNACVEYVKSLPFPKNVKSVVCMHCDGCKTFTS